MPTGESFLSTIKSNKAIMLDKSRRFRKTLGGYDWSKSPKLDLPKATPEQLKEIRLRIKLENRKIKLKQFVIVLIITIPLTIALIYIMF